MTEFGQIKKKSPSQIFSDEELSIWCLLKKYNVHKDCVLAERFINFFLENNLLSVDFSKKRFLEKILTYNMSSYSRRFKKPAVISLLSHFYAFIHEKGLTFPVERVPISAGRTVVNRQRIHDFEVVCTLFGSLLGDLYAQKSGLSTRFRFWQGESNQAYLMWLHQYFAERDYCSPKIPKRTEHRKFKIGIIHGKRTRTPESVEGLNYAYSFTTFSYSNLNWLFEAFYVNKKKVIPDNILLEQYLTPRALAFWLMDDGSFHKKGKTVVFCTESFEKGELERLCGFLKVQYDLVCTLQKYRQNYRIYLRVHSFHKFKMLVQPYLHESMLYKLGLSFFYLMLKKVLIEKICMKRNFDCLSGSISFEHIF